LLCKVLITVIPGNIFINPMSSGFGVLPIFS
jgi:hypothetical protein